MHTLLRQLVSLIAGSLLVLPPSHGQGLNPDIPGLQRATEIHAENSAAIFRNPRVVGTGVGINAAGKPVIKVYIASGDARGLPTKVADLDIEVVLSGPIVARRGNCDSNADQNACSQVQPLAPPGSSATDRYDRPVPIGVSAGHTNITAGTIGCRVQIGCHSYALSNNHVFADEGAAAIGDDVIQPGPVDGGSAPGDVIGQLYDYEPIIFSTSAYNTIDAAIVDIEFGSVGTATLPDGYGQPRTNPIDAVPGMNVMKSGRTTGFTRASVDAISAVVSVGYDTGTARFVNQIIIKPGTFSDGGDSGSLIVVDGGPNDRRPVGLLFAGSNALTVANPIQPVLDRFGAVIEGE